MGLPHTSPSPTLSSALSPTHHHSVVEMIMDQINVTAGRHSFYLMVFVELAGAMFPCCLNKTQWLILVSFENNLVLTKTEKTDYRCI